MEWLWDRNQLTIHLPHQDPRVVHGSYVEVVRELTSLGHEGWDVASCVAAGNWLFWTLKRPAW